MGEFGKFSEITFVDNTSPAINAANLNELERVVKLADSELARSSSTKLSELIEYFFQRNTNQFLYFSDYTSWTNYYPSNCDDSNDFSSQIMGNSAMKVEVTDAASSWLSHTLDGTFSYDFTKFYDGSASGDSDLIVIVVKVSDASAFSDFEFRFGTDFSNCYHIELKGSLSDGWNAFYPQKSDFTIVGSPAGWDDISYIRLAPATTASQVGEYILYQSVSLARQDPDYSGYPNCFQKYTGSAWESFFFTIYDTCLLYRDWNDFIEKPGIMKPDAEDYEDELVIYDNVIEFVSKFEMFCKYAGETCSITFQVDYNNYAEVYISSNTFYLDVVEATVLTSNSIALSNNLIKNEKIYIYFERKEDTFRAILKKYGEEIKILEYETSISTDSEGQLYLGQSSSNSFSLVTDFEISNRPITYLRDENLPRVAWQKVDQEFTNNTMTNVLGLWIYLQPFRAYKVDLYVVAHCSSATPDIQIKWVLTNCHYLSQRQTLGPAIGNTDTGDTNMQAEEFHINTEVPYGIDGTGNESVIHEEILILAENDAGKIQIQASQNNTDAGNPVVLDSGSHIIATPIELSSQNNFS